MIHSGHHSLTSDNWKTWKFQLRLLAVHSYAQEQHCDQTRSHHGELIMKYTTAVCLTFASMLLCACTQSGIDVEAERAALRAAADAYHEAGEAMDPESFANSYTSDGLILPPNEAAVSGRGGAHEFLCSFAEAPGAGVSFFQHECRGRGERGHGLHAGGWGRHY